MRWPTTAYGDTVNYQGHAVDGIYPAGYGNMVINKDFEEPQRLLSTLNTCGVRNFWNCRLGAPKKPVFTRL